jgi:hypothetical protein
MIRSYQGKLPKIAAGCYVDPSAQILGDVEIGERSSVWMNAVLRGDVNSIRVGSCSNVQDCSVLHGQRNLYAVTVGDWVTIGHNATTRASARAPSSPPAPSFRSTRSFRHARFGPACPPKCAASSPIRTAPSSSNTPRITSTTLASIWLRPANNSETIFVRSNRVPVVPKHCPLITDR